MPTHSEFKAALLQACPDITDCAEIIEIIRQFKDRGLSQGDAYDTLDNVCDAIPAEATNRERVIDEIQYAMETVWWNLARFGTPIWEVGTNMKDRNSR